MFDTMTLTKAAGALIGAMLFLMLASWGASALYSVGAAHHGEGEEHAQAYTVPVEEAAPAEEAAAEQVDVAALLTTADAAKGEGEFKKCQACHKLDGTDGTGPHLNGVVDRDKGSVAGFGYSETLATMEGAWTVENLYGFIKNPKGYAPGTKMSFAGIKNDAALANLIAYLQTQG